MSTVDVVIPCYNYARFLNCCATSILTQEHVDLRVLIIDDASSDDTAQVARQIATVDQRVTVRRHETNRGHIDTYNEGIQWATGDYFLLLSADDYLLPGALRRATELMDAHPKVGFTFGKAIDLHGLASETNTLANTAVVSVVNDSTSRILRGEEFFSLVESVHSVNIVRASTAIVRTELQRRLGGYRRELPHTGDLELWLRLAAHAAVGVFGTYQAVSRFHGNNMQNAYYQDKYLPDLEQRKAAFDCILQHCSAVLQNAHQVHRKLVIPLASEAMQHANSAFNDGDLELARKLSDFAVAAHRDIRETVPWFVLRCKQRIGIRLWRAVAPAFAQLRARAKVVERLMEPKAHKATSLS